VRYVRSFKLPTLVLGGGGYTVKNVARCWTYETGVLLGMQLSNELPMNDHIDLFGPKFQLHPDITLRVDNHNTRSYLDSVRARTLENLRMLQGAPSVQMHEIPPELLLGPDPTEAADAEDPDLRESQRALDARIAPDDEFYDDDHDHDPAEAAALVVI
jgi:histone deacetylase 3